MRVPSTRSLIMLEAVARLGTYSAAAEELSITPSAISHRIADLEEELGRQLFIRNGRTIHITPEGEEYAREIRIALRMMAQSQNRLQLGSASVPIRIAMIPPFAHYWMVPRLPSLEQSFPEYSFDFVFDNAPSLNLGAEVDFAIDYGTDDYCAERGGDPIVPRHATLVATHDYAAARLGNTRRSRFDGVRFLTNIRLPHLLPQWLSMFNETLDPPRTEYRFDSASLLLSAIRKGFGAGLACRNLVAVELAEERLVAPFEETLFISESYYFARMPRMLNDRLAKDIRDWFLSEAKLQ